MIGRENEWSRTSSSKEKLWRNAQLILKKRISVNISPCWFLHAHERWAWNFSSDLQVSHGTGSWRCRTRLAWLAIEFETLSADPPYFQELREQTMVSPMPLCKRDPGTETYCISRAVCIETLGANRERAQRSTKTEPIDINVKWLPKVWSWWTK